MGRNIFTFEGGGDLTTMGACWFVSYKYHLNINESHNNWQLIKTISNRVSVYNRTEKLHNYWLSEVVKMNSNNLNKNKLNLSGEEVISMAKDLLNCK